MKSQRRLVHVTTSDMALWLLLGPQLEAFAAAGFEVIGVSSDGPYVAALEEAGIRHVVLRNSTRSVNPVADARAFVELASTLRTLNPDVVHTHNPKPGVYGRLVARGLQVPAIVNTVHGLFAQPSDPLWKRSVVYGLERIAAACSDMELVQNPEDLETLRRLRVPSRKLRLLGNGVDLDRFQPANTSPDRIAALRSEMGAKPDELVVGVVGRLVWEKGYREVFDAAKRLRSTFPHVRFVVVGPLEPDKPDALTKADLDHAQRSGNVTFLGYRADVHELYAAFDVYLLASHREGFPRSAMEAAATGLPVIATDVRGCRQVVDQGVTGYLVPPRDGAQLADAIRQIVGDPLGRRQMGRLGRVKAEREFNQQVVIERTLDVYAELLGPPP